MAKTKWEVYAVFDELNDAKNCVDDIESCDGKARIENVSNGFAVFQEIEK
jgi:hypothetical protein